jgi:hypothetical protein
MAQSSGYAAVSGLYPNINMGSMNWKDGSVPGANPGAFIWNDNLCPSGDGEDYTLFFYADSECEDDDKVGEMKIKNSCYAVLHPCNARAIFEPNTTYYYVVAKDDDDDDDDDDFSDPIGFTVDYSDIDFASLGCEPILKCATCFAQNDLSLSERLKNLLAKTSNFLFSPSIAYAYIDLPGYIILLATDRMGNPVENVVVRLESQYKGAYVLTSMINGCDVDLASAATYQVTVDNPYYDVSYVESPIYVEPCFQITVIRVIAQ